MLSYFSTSLEVRNGNYEQLISFRQKRREFNLFTKAKKSVTEALLRPNTKLIRFRNPHPSHRSDITFINLNDLSSSLLLPRQASWVKFELPRVLQHKSHHITTRISSIAITIINKMNREFIRFDLHSLPFVVKKIEAHCKMHNSNRKRLKNKFLCLSMTYTDKAMMTGIIILKQEHTFRPKGLWKFENYLS